VNIKPQIGIIVAGSEPPIEGFKEGLAEFGWTEGSNVNLELRVAQGQLDRLPGFASEIVDLDVDLIAVIGAVTVRASRTQHRPFRSFSRSWSSRSATDWARTCGILALTLPE
jgi:hypothetical protein